MAKVKRNILATFMGRGSSALVSFIFFPLYLPLLGKEGFGLVALGIGLLQGITFINAAIEPVWIREVALRESKGECIWPLIRIAEILNIFTLVLLLIFSDNIINHAVLNIPQSDSFAKEAIAMKSLLLALMVGFIGNTYGSIIFGRQQMVINSILISGKAIMDSVGAYIVLLLTRGDILSYFNWLLFSSIVYTLSSGIVAWLPYKQDIFKWRIRRKHLSGLEKLSITNVAVTGCAAVYVASEKWFIGTMISMEAIGLFTLLMTPMRLVGNLAGLIQSVLMPRLTQLNTLGESPQLIDTFRKGLVATSFILIFPILVLCIQPSYMFYLWLRDTELARELGDLAPYAAVITYLVVHSGMLYNADLAHGKVGRRLYLSIGRIFTLAFVSLFFLERFGMAAFMLYFLLFSVLEIIILGGAVIKSISNYIGGNRNLLFMQWANYSLIFPLAIVLLSLLLVNVFSLNASIQNHISNLVTIFICCLITFVLLMLYNPFRLFIESVYNLILLNRIGKKLIRG